MRSMIAWFAHNHIAANLLLGLIVLLGLAAIFAIPKKTFPDLDVPFLTITVPYLGAAPEEVEQGVCIRIEEQLEGIEGIKKIRSIANEGLCFVQIEAFENVDTSIVLDDVKSRVDAIDTFPEEIEKPIVSLASKVRAVMDIAVTGPTDERTLKILGQQVRDDIAGLPEVTQVSLRNTRPYEISLEVSEASLQRHGLTFDQVVAAVRMRSLDLPGGSIKTKDGEILLRTKGQAYWGDEFARLIIRTRADGTRLYLGDVATIIDGFEDTDQALRFDGKPAAMIRVSRVGEQDILEITAAVRGYLDTASSRLPQGVELTVWNDNSILLKDRLDTLLDSGRQGFLMVLLLLALFLKPRLAFWISLGVPVAFLGAIFASYVAGLSIDAIALFGFILVLGILVDDAIVVGENVHSNQKTTGNLLTGAVIGTQQVSVPVIFGVLTTLTTFMPFLFGPGTFGQIFGVIATVVICCLIFSLIESQLVLPAHLGHSNIHTAAGEIGLLMIPIVAIFLLEITDDIRSYLTLGVITATILLALHFFGLSRPVASFLMYIQTQFSDMIESIIHHPLRHWVQVAVTNRYTTVSIAIVALLSSVAIIMSDRLPFSFFPPLESDQVIATLTMPLGTSADVTSRAVRYIEDTARQLANALSNETPNAPPVTHILTALGSHPTTMGGFNASGGGGIMSAGGHLGEITLQLTPTQSRAVATREVANRWRELTGTIADAVELKFSSTLFTVGNAIDIQLEGNDVEELRIVAEKIKAELSKHPGVIDIADSFRAGKKELRLNISVQGESLGISLRDLARQIRQGFYGEEAQRVQRGRDDVKIMVRYTQTERESLGSLDTMRVRTSTGSEVPFTTVATAELGRGYASIKRADRQRVVNVTADVDRTKITANEVIADLRGGSIEAIMAQHPRVEYRLEGEQREQAEAVENLIPMFGIALFAIFALLAIPLKSYSQPLIIMSIIPFAFVGAIWGHLFMKIFALVSGISMMSVMGFIAASGVVVNSSLVLVHNINQRRQQNEGVYNAILAAVASRCRPIVLTSLTTFVGLLPLMLNRSVQAQFLVPMAVSLAFGVLFATLVTLFIVPSAYLILADLSNWRRHDSDPIKEPLLK